MGTLKYAYSGLPAGCTSLNTTSLQCIPSLVGMFTVKVFVNDSGGHSATSTTPLEVAPPSYTVTFNETGLPSGTAWYVVLNGYANTSITTTVTFSEPDGTYSYSVVTPIAIGTWEQFVGSPSSGQVTVSGASTGASITYTKQFLLIMNPSVGGTTSPATGWYDAGSVIEMTATPDRGYAFSSWSGSGPGAYSGASNPYNITLSGSDNETAMMIPSTYSVTFTESGLPAGATWYVALNGVETTSSTATIVLMLADGNYTYAVKPVVSLSPGTQFVASPSIGNLTVYGSAVSQSVTYGTQYYLTVSVSPAGTGTVNQPSGWFESGAKATLQATAGAGFYFSSWRMLSSTGYTGTNNPATFTMTAPISEEAMFDQNACWISGTVTPVQATLLIDGVAFQLASNGAFNDTVGSGMHTIAVSYPGYQSISINVTLSIGSGVNENLALKQLTNGGSTGTASVLGESFPWLIVVVIAIVAAILGFVVGWRRYKGKGSPGNSPSQMGGQGTSWNPQADTAGEEAAIPAVAYYTAPSAHEPPPPSYPEEKEAPPPDYLEDDESESAQASAPEQPESSPSIQEILRPPRTDSK
jgi:hypothetical protein